MVRKVIYEYAQFTIQFQFSDIFAEEEWLNSIESSSSDITVMINEVRLFAGVSDSVLNVFEKSESVSKLENLKNNLVKKNQKNQKTPLRVWDILSFFRTFATFFEIKQERAKARKAKNFFVLALDSWF